MENIPIHWIKSTSHDLSWKKAKEAGLLNIISHFNLGLALTALLRSGMATRLRAQRQINDASLFEGLNPKLSDRFMDYMRIHGIVEQEGRFYFLTDRGWALTSPPALAHLAFYTQVYGPIVDSILDFLTGDIIYGKDIERDGRALGEHCATLFKHYHTESMLQILSSLEGETIYDVGCGGGQFLVDVCMKSDKVKGIGLDISPGAIEFANDLASKYGLSDRLKFFVGDAFDETTWPEESFSSDILCAHGVIHEHFRDGEDAVVNILNRFAGLMNKSFKAFILGEPELRYDLDQSDPDLYLIHIFTAQGFPRHREAWLQVFEKSQLMCRNVFSRAEEGPRFNFFELIPRTIKPIIL